MSVDFTKTGLLGSDSQRILTDGSHLTDNLGVREVYPRS